MCLRSFIFSNIRKWYCRESIKYYTFVCRWHFISIFIVRCWRYRRFFESRLKNDCIVGKAVASFFNPIKTVAIFFSIVLDLVKPSLIFNNTILDFVDNHKHLSLKLSSDGKWHAHIDNILTSASRTLGILRSLKYKLCRKALNQIYLSYLRPLLEYASVVWDGCTLYEKKKPDQIQYEAARLVTGLTRSVSTEKLIKEIGWLSLSDRRLFQKAVTMFKIKMALHQNI